MISLEHTETMPPDMDLLRRIKDELLKREALNLARLSLQLGEDASRVKLHVEDWIEQDRIACIRPALFSPRDVAEHMHYELNLVYYRWKRADDHAYLWEQRIAVGY